MGLFDFVKGVGEKLFGPDEEELAAQRMKEMEAEAALQAENQAVADKLMGLIASMDLQSEDLSISFADGIATLAGSVPSNEAREKIILLVGNIDRISQVDDQLQVVEPEPEAQFYVVKKGDSLSKIAKEYYGDFQKYMAIFEANRPMLSDPDKIYPGQTLRIPPQA